MIGTLQAQSTSQLLSTLKRAAEQQNTLKTEQVWMLDSVISKDYSKTYYTFNEYGYLTDLMYYRAEWDRVDEFGEPYSDSKLVWTLVADETYYWEDENSYHIEYEFEPNGRCSYMAIYSLDEQGNKSTCIGKVETEYRDGKWVENTTRWMNITKAKTRSLSFIRNRNAPTTSGIIWFTNNLTP